MSINESSEVSVGRVVLASFIGTTIEWYDFFIYGTAAALVFNRLFFPEFDDLTGTMFAYATFAIGFFARPIGGIVFGHFGDRLGRKTMLVTTLTMMGIATFLIGVLPTYEVAGIAAPISLVALRFIQGLGVGGEWGGAVLMAVEHGHRGRRGLYGSWVQAGVPVGLLIATATFAIFSSLPERQFLAWGWRVPFLLGIVLLGVGMFIRVRILESPLFANIKSKQPLPSLPVLEVLRKHPGNVLLAMGARFAENASFYIFSVFVISYATGTLDVQKNTVLTGIWLAAVVQFFAIPLFGHLSDRWGRRPIYLGGAVFTVLFAFPFFWLVSTEVNYLVWLAIILGLAGHSAMYGPQAAFFSELFGTNVRYTGASLGYQVASPLAGGLAPLVATQLLSFGKGDPSWVAAYLIGTGILTLVAVYFASETYKADINS
ncbi:MAG: MHS family MFS transporter [Planctomycetaceae bacterium]|nr:MHS family MFS transporter [Planctomycetales bacterium]MCB9921598.1 MHS family MFS transporter [Planctomycetaceae bacterium]